MAIVQIAATLLMALTQIMIAELVVNSAQAQGRTWAETPYQEQKVLFDFYFDEPEKINSALYWIRAQINPLIDDP